MQDSNAKTPSGAIDPKLAHQFLKVVNDPVRHGVPELHFHFWKLADARAKDSYLRLFRTETEWKRWFEAGHLAEPYDFEELAALPEGSLGRAYHDHLRNNGLDPKLLLNYPGIQRELARQGHLADMPPEIQYATARGFQIHDILHPLTGLDTSPLGEIALQAFTMAQTGSPYPSFWMAIATSRLAFLTPEVAAVTLDAITHGWQLGRRARNLTFPRWEEMFDRPLEEIRREYALV